MGFRFGLGVVMLFGGRRSMFMYHIRLFFGGVFSPPSSCFVKIWVFFPLGGDSLHLYFSISKPWKKNHSLVTLELVLLFADL